MFVTILNDLLTLSSSGYSEVKEVYTHTHTQPHVGICIYICYVYIAATE